jgi:F-type H+-transporting ATPase subunit b
VEHIHVGVIPDITLFVQLILFLIFMFAMKKIFFDPYLSVYEERENFVNALLKEAEENNKKTQEILEEVEKKLKEAKAEAQKIMEEAKTETNQLVTNIIKSATEEAEKSTFLHLHRYFQKTR